MLQLAGQQAVPASAAAVCTQALGRRWLIRVSLRHKGKRKNTLTETLDQQVHRSWTERKQWGRKNGDPRDGEHGNNGRSKYSALYRLLESVQILRQLHELNKGTQLPWVREHEAGLLCHKGSLAVLKHRQNISTYAHKH